VLYKLLIEQHLDVESVENVVVYGKRVFYVKCVSVDLFGYEGFAYVVCDIERKGDETARFFIAAREDKLGSDVVGESLKGKGKFVLVSSERISVEDVIPLYYTRQFAENLFGVSKSFLDFLPIRTHNIETLRGYLMLTFIALIIYLEMKRCLSDKFTVEEALTEMANLMAKTYDETTIVCEPTKNMKNIASLLGYMVPMKLGV
jgi:transposase